MPSSFFHSIHPLDRLPKTEAAAANWNRLYTLSGDQGNAWDANIVLLGAFANKTVQFKITGTTGTCFMSDIGLDGFWIYDFCQPNKNITSTINIGAATVYFEAGVKITSDAVLQSGNMILDAGQ